MSQRTALLIATALTVFMVMVMGGVAFQVFQKSMTNVQGVQINAPTQANANANAAAPTDAATVDQLAQRESAFRDLIQQANQKLEESYKQQQDLTQQVQVLKNQSPADQSPAARPVYKVTADQAKAIALATVPGAVLLRAPELVSFKNVPAYEVTLDKGTVYIDANTGQVLYNSAAVVVVRGAGASDSGNAVANAAPAAPSKPSGESEHKEESKKEEGKKEESKKEESKKGH